MLVKMRRDGSNSTKFKRKRVECHSDSDSHKKTSDTETSIEDHANNSSEEI